MLPGDTPDTLATRVLIAEHQLYPRILADFVSRERDPDWLVAKVASSPDAPRNAPKDRHGAPGWKVGSPSSDKFFAIMWLGHHGEDGTSVLVKASGQDEMAALIDADPALYFRPPYYGPSDWIGIRLDRNRVDWDHVTSGSPRAGGSAHPRGSRDCPGSPTNSDHGARRRAHDVDNCLAGPGHRGDGADAGLPRRLLEQRAGERWTEECWTVPARRADDRFGRAGAGGPSTIWEYMRIERGGMAC